MKAFTRALILGGALAFVVPAVSSADPGGMRTDEVFRE
jgi:hypothetical protein